MDISAYRKFNQFILNKRDDVEKILNNKLKDFPIKISKDDKATIFQDSAIVLFEKINSGNMKTINCSGVEYPVFDNTAARSLLSYYIEICYRQTYKFLEKKSLNPNKNKQTEKKKLDLSRMM